MNTHSKYNTTYKTGLLSVLIAVMVLTTTTLCGCSNDADDPTPRPIGISSGAVSGFIANPYSRAEGESDDSESATAVMPETIGVYATQSNSAQSVFDNRTFYYKYGETFLNMEANTDWQWPDGFSWPADNDWPYRHLEYWDYSAKYHFYAYAPHCSVTGSGVEMRSLAYGSMDEFRYYDIPPYSSRDYVVAAKRVEVDGGTEPLFTMRHLGARVCLRVKIGEKYSELRRIRITSITINDVATGQYYRCDVNLNTGNISTSTYGRYTSSTPEIPIIPIFSDEDGLLLSATEYHQFGSLYVMPQRLSALTVNVTYDVYDLYSENPTRKDQYISNTITLGHNVEAGKYYNVDILVSPRFLYVLSDNDVPPDWLMEVE